MKSIDKYKGIIPAFYACYDSNGEVSLDKVKRQVQYFIDKGVKGIYVNGSSGECIYLNVEERKSIIEAVMEVAKGQLTVINHVACNNTRDSVDLAKHSEKLGVDAIAAIPPIYFKLPEYSIKNYWNTISDAASNTDFIIYNIPQLAGVALSTQLYDEMRQNPKVIGVKNSSIPVQDIQNFVASGGDNYIVFNGPDEQFLGGRMMGAEGGIGGTYGVMPELFLKLDALIKAHQFEQAQKLQFAINEIIAVLVSGHGNMYAIAKEVLRLNEKLDLGSVREPLTPLNDSDKSLAADAVQKINHTRNAFI
ncbi:dihydrodipicolinate synthase family protein [Staphylococcus schleiferi]|uniref:N-acetylneuraminate lyase n=3 Tax=Staphylococcus schleiferi TaxID=1295 RepID=A0A7Z7VXM0_STASC|nr:dihydrodipicolinate synthase family protein [Staphylococcus schleiferi]QGS47273.1 N-acetylneuraminate lyase [Mammaliicoccus fleurettii]NHA33551.1 N-acetylneuraminate lyase [Staphylococcus schleiferi]RTX79840.1 N-acetylneuraminate lyase [Staphylococcus schleiferi subsp. schleiferi]UXR54185.1 dihydrodipicolinate synthase family protein [Staphylococcus schleiferi]UXR56543.1 dihydrodipicolinate synthase family protein [Staphylococcus schleiferi]